MTVKNSKKESIIFRTTTVEKKGFVLAAGLAGQPLSTWIRERLRRQAIQELGRENIPVPFVEAIKKAEIGKAEIGKVEIGKVEVGE